jgi:hypothetical protein
VLQKPKQRVADHAVELVVGIPGTYYQAEIQVFVGGGHLNPPALRPLYRLTVAFPHGTGDPVDLQVPTETTERRNYPTTAAANLELSVIGEMIFNRAPVTGQN